MNKRKKLAIIDGKSVFYRGYYAMGNLAMADGTPTGGVYGFTAMSLELIKKLEPDYVCVAWDKAKTNIRKRLAVYPDYKSGRKAAPEDFYKQMPLLFELLDAFGWPLYEFDDYEADDIMHTLSKKADLAGLDTVLVTSDLDSLQSISSHTNVYALKRGFSNIERFDVESFERKYGITKEQFLDFKSLKGDSSDNIPGVPGVGEKTAVKLLQEYNTLDSIYKNIDKIKPTLAKRLQDGMQSAYMSKEISTLYDDAPIDLDLESMDVGKVNTNKLKSLLKRLEFRTLLKNLPDYMQHSEYNDDDAETSFNSTKSKKVINIESLSEAKRINILNDKEGVVLYSRSLDSLGRHPQILIAAHEDSIFLINAEKLGRDNFNKVITGIKPKSVIGYDLKNVFKIFINARVALPSIRHDTLIGDFLINSLQREVSLSDKAYRDLGIDIDVDNITAEELANKAGDIVGIIQFLTNKQSEQMSELTGLIKLSESIEWPIIPVLARMELTGIYLNTNYLKAMSEEFEGVISDIEQEIYGHANKEFNISSPAQLSQILFEELGLPTQGIKKGKNAYSTAAGELDKLRWTHPVINLITRYREYTKLKSTYIDSLPKLVDSDSRIHTDFRLTATQTGRLSSAEPNLQNIPVRTDIGKKIRTAFESGSGKVLVSADYSQFELRLAAAMAGDDDLIELFNQGADIHTATAAQVYGIGQHEVSPDQRRHAKIINFGILYGMSAHGLSISTGMSLPDAKQFLEKYKELRKPLFEYTSGLVQFAKSKGYVETLFGRRRPMPDINSSNYIIRNAAERAAMNMPIQGTEADLMKMAMIAIDKNLNSTNIMNRAGIKHDSGDFPRQILQVHDSIMVECLDEHSDIVKKLLIDTMENIYTDLPVKLKVDISIGKNWGDL